MRSACNRLVHFLCSVLFLFHLTSIPRNCVLWLKTVFHGCKSAALSVRFATSVAIPGLCRTNMGSVSKLSGSGGGVDVAKLRWQES